MTHCCRTLLTHLCTAHCGTLLTHDGLPSGDAPHSSIGHTKKVLVATIQHGPLTTARQAPQWDLPSSRPPLIHPHTSKQLVLPCTGHHTCIQHGPLTTAVQGRPHSWAQLKAQLKAHNSKLGSAQPSLAVHPYWTFLTKPNRSNRPCGT